ncbi:head GIN domain-containing protein [Sungkyunkwania multivorans]|uniref:Head GIN domain-containing protein n=1 Tax=Sungkyunkwania multivorans TaxID=1173618 RepID=A0ABW3CXS3_9FLAO
MSRNLELRINRRSLVNKAFSTLFIGLLTISAANAQWWGGKKIKGNGKVVTETRNVGSYDKVAVAGSFDVELVAGNEGKLTLKGEENLLEYIVTEVDGDKLKIKTEKGINIQPSRNTVLLITVPFKDISMVSLAGSGDVVGKSRIKADNFKTSLSGSGDVSLEVDANEVKANLAGSGDIELSGTANSVDISLAGSGDIDAYGLKSKTAEVSVSGSGDVNVYCSEAIKARVVGSGDISYRGNPEKQDTKAVGSGDISSN